MSKDIKPKQRLGKQTSRKQKIIGWAAALVVMGGGAFAAYHYAGTTEVVVPTARVRRGEFVISTRTRGEIKSTRSTVLTAPQVPNLRIVRLAEDGKPIRKGDVVVEFDSAQQEQSYLEFRTNVRTAESEIVQTQAAHRITNEQDAMSLMRSTYNVERAKLEAGKAEILSEIQGAKNRIDVGIAEGELRKVNATINAHKVNQKADMQRLDQRKAKTIRDTERVKGYLANMVLRAPNDGILTILPNFRAQGSFGSMPPPFKEGDNAWTGAAIAEIPDLSSMRVEMKLEEVERGHSKLGQQVRVRVDAIADKEFIAELDWISPVATLNFSRFTTAEKSFPAYATLKNLDPRLRPGMSATAEIIIESEPNALLIPARASFLHNGKPAVYVQRGQAFELRQIEVGKRNENDIVVLSGLKEGEVVTLENPFEAAKRAKKL
ncbi:MAG TPA: HlyD family efflux transporter periplasmic adaptor subunit [Bryobacteraceae bacterium]|nr:HlyD family efflux transporter periplasmic adaptor subunit [Bryobacteraceae bacterium]HOQ47480.1 HlyD family efflux transporter periplasmic adaptor subunit [Bryobacteraceae bacterium]HPU73195.1 HlyD family efflux transporter periplasmic adaptor subunit [Bryobacteraceae bacterium]